MRVEVDLFKAKPNRKISTCKKDEAFRIAENWYSKINISDSEIKDDFLTNSEETFAEHHTLTLCEGSFSEDLMACIHLTSMSFVYINKETVADEWASAKVVISALS